MTCPVESFVVKNIQLIFCPSAIIIFGIDITKYKLSEISKFLHKDDNWYV